MKNKKENLYLNNLKIKVNFMDIQNEYLKIKQVFKDNKILKINDLITLLKNKYNYSESQSLKLISKLIDINKIQVLSNKENVEKISFKKYIFNIYSFNFWITTIIIIFYLISINFYELIYFRAFFGLLFLFFIPGYCTINILYPQDNKLNVLAKISYSGVLSLLITGCLLTTINFVLQIINEFICLLSVLILNLILFFLMIWRKYNSFKFNLEYYKSIKNKNYIIKYILLPVLLIGVLAVLFRIFVNYFFLYYNSDIPYFSWASDQWIHYAVVRNIIKYSYFDLSYMEIYRFYYPIFYISLASSYYITNIGLISLFKILSIYFGLFIVWSFISLSKLITDNWKISIICGILITIAAPLTFISTSVIWPQLFGHYIILMTLMSFIRLNNSKSIKNIFLFLSLFLLLGVSHIVSVIVGIVIIFISFILLSFKQGFDKLIFILICLCTLFSIFWTVQFNLSDPQFGINSIFDLLKYLGIGCVGLIIGILFLRYVANKNIYKETIDLKFKFGRISYIFISIIILLLYNPLFWLYLPITKDFIRFSSYEYFYIMLLSSMIPSTIAIFGFLMVFRTNKTGFITLLGWLLSIVLLTTFFGLLGTFEQPSRTTIFIFEPISIYGSYTIFKIIKNNKKRHNLFIFFIIIISITPLTLFSFTSSSLGSGGINFRSEVYAELWYNKYNNWSSNTLYIADIRGMYLNFGIFWDKNRKFEGIQNLDYLNPENYDLILNITNTEYKGYNIMFYTNYYVHTKCFHNVYRSKIQEMYLTTEIENEWINNPNKPFIRIYSSHLTEIYMLLYINITK